MKFEGTSTYVADDDLKLAVNAAVTLQRPLLIKGEPGTGKTTTLRSIVRLVQTRGGTVVLAAPTGRAARRVIASACA